MQRNKLTFNDLPEVVGELCERISSMENLLTEKLHQQHNEVKKDTHVPMTVDEVCEYLGISKSSFYYKAKHGGIPIIKQGKHLFVYRDELDKWLESGRKGEKMCIRDRHSTNLFHSLNAVHYRHTIVLIH